MTSRIGKRTTAILAFVALALSVIVPLSVPKAFSAPDCHNAEVKDFDAKIDKVVADLAAKAKEKGEYVYSGQHFPELNSIAPGFGMYREITKVIKGNGYTFEDILGEGAKFKAVSLGSGGGLETPKVEIHLTSPTKTFDEAKFKDAVSKELTKFLKEHPREICEPGTDEPIVEPTKPSEPTTKPTGDNPKPGCKKAEVKDYEAGIEKVVDGIEASKHQERVTGKTESENGASSFLTVFYVYEWNTAILRHVNPAITDKLILTEEQTRQVFGDGAKLALTAVGKPAVKDEQGNISYSGVGSETFHAEWVEKFDREAMTKIITDKVSEFLEKNPQEICEGGNNTKPGDNPKPGCHKAEISDYKEKIEQEVDKIDKSKRENSYSWSGLLLNNIVPAIKAELELTDEQTEQVFGEGAIAVALGVPTIDDPNVPKVPTDHDWLRISRIHIDHATKFDREAMTKIITDKVSEFLEKNPQEICEEGTDPKPGTTEPTTEPTGPGTDEPTTETTKSGDDTKPGGDSKEGKTPALEANNGEQTVLEGATAAGGLATTGAVGLIALGVSALLVGAGVALAIRRRKQTNV